MHLLTTAGDVTRNAVGSGQCTSKQTLNSPQAQGHLASVRQRMEDAQPIDTKRPPNGISRLSPLPPSLRACTILLATVLATFRPTTETCPPTNDEHIYGSWCVASLSRGIDADYVTGLLRSIHVSVPSKGHQVPGELLVWRAFGDGSNLVTDGHIGLPSRSPALP